MADLTISAVARAMEELTTFVMRLPLGSSSSSSIPNCNVGKIQEDIKRLSRTLNRIRARLEDAEKMQITYASVRLWLTELEGVAYDAEDVLDELRYEVLRLQSEGNQIPPRSHMVEITDMAAVNLGEMVLPVSDSSSSSLTDEIVAFLHSLEGRIEEINSKFDVISKDRAVLQLNENEGWKQAEFEIPSRQPTTSLLQESCVVGREEDLKIVKKFLLSDDKFKGSSKIPVMATLGIGGLGKTTLVQLAYNDGEIRKQFDLKAWIYVSEDFDLVQLTRAMIECFTGEVCNLSQLDPLQIKLQEMLAGKCFLLVLDDVWETGLVQMWDSLRLPLLRGSMGSKIIITTRSEQVSRIVGASSTHHLPGLRDEDCLQLFNQRAFEGRNTETLPQNLKDMAKGIAKKCRGVPLVAKIFGGELRWEDDEQKWKDMLEGDIWDIQNNGIMPVLRLSYNHLPAHLRKCFRYCSLFPKGYKFHRGQLVRLWMAKGYIQTKGTRYMEDVGRGYFDDLVSRSFFQCSFDPEIFYVHDLIHDLAMLVSRDECYILEDGKTCGNSEGDVRHLSILSGQCIVWPRPVDELAGTLRSFLLTNITRSIWFHIKSLNDGFTAMKHLRVLHLTGVGIYHLPDSIGCLKHLRCLSLRLPKVRSLPKSVGTLYLLQTLDLDGCSALVCSPNSISQLVNLRHLTCKLGTGDPMGIFEKLTNLVYINLLECKGWASLPPLGRLPSLKRLSIWSADRVEYIGREFFCGGFPRLEKLGLHNMSMWQSWCGAEKDECPRLRELHVSGCSKLTSFSLINLDALQSLQINDCSALEFWAVALQLRQLPSLRRFDFFFIQGAYRVRGDSLGGFQRH